MSDENGEDVVSSPESAALQRFGGRMTTPLAFAGDHVVIPIDIDDPPAGCEPYREFWYVTPDGERRLYADPPAATDHVGQYHAMDRALGATIEWTRTESGLVVDLSGEDGLDLRLELDVHRPPAVRLCNAFLGLVPSRLLHRAFVPRLAAVGAKTVLGVEEFAVAGATETGVPFRTDAEHLARITDARLELDDKPAGEWHRSTGLPEFGDIAAPERSLFVRGGMYLPFESG